ncbi:glycerophosphodiester phosphodiesterase [Alteribacter keqinensis]|uniref:Glycerophosphodiester phosphodiesterase n=1 Tax=Alteribacter keqinensis TaxID=2483800 RepID=A0A3M7TVT1_9BACI|nr:glycerophosphodiester phosphodiesterase family protein [Alteribacter keqinensis]RNA68884.1 glycerophosphodiester phosphodiesterase [Alteribacter keqinensis]
MEVIAHRGNTFYAPENTMAAFLSAASYNISGIELDVQWTKDGVPVVFHDEKVDRTTNGSGWIRSFTYRELRQLDAGSWFAGRFGGEKIPSLQEVLEWMKGEDITLHMEVKKPPRQFEELLDMTLGMIENHGMAHKTVVSTFYHPLLTYMAGQKRTHFQRAFLTKTPLFRGIRYLNSIQAHAIHIRHSYQAMRFYPLWAKSGIPVRAYTINREKEALRCKRLNVTSIITDDPKTMTSLFPQPEQSHGENKI